MAPLSAEYLRGCELKICQITACRIASEKRSRLLSSYQKNLAVNGQMYSKIESINQRSYKRGNGSDIV
uniref:Uncharacterized protein n=1 Tax=Salix viminalis TaxID=40686 RepID=A0A6N2NFD3_SALVM